MYIETVKNLLCDEVSETIAALAESQVIEYNGRTYEIPRAVTHSGYKAVMAWRDGVLHGIKGDMDVLQNGIYCGSVTVWTLHNILAGETFVIRSAEPDDYTVIIRSASDLAEYLQTSINGISEHVRTYSDYETEIKLSDDGIVLQTTAGETGKTLAKELVYPFSGEAYDDATSGLQCWADATYWDAVRAGEV